MALRRMRRKLLIGGAVVAIGVQARSMLSPGKSALPTLSSAEFNGEQQQYLPAARLLLQEIVMNASLSPAELADSLLRQKNGVGAHENSGKLTLFRLLGCPYCARVKSVLDFKRIPYSEILIDPISGGGGFEDPRYTFVPQLKFTFDRPIVALRPPGVSGKKPLPNASGNRKQKVSTTDVSGDVDSTNFFVSPPKDAAHEPEKSAPSSTVAAPPQAAAAPATSVVVVVDSEEIIKMLAVPLGFENDLSEPRVVATRTWLLEHYQKVSFAALCGTWGNAFELYPQVVPPNWNYFPFRLVGATALFALSRFKIKPKLKAKAAALPSPSSAGATSASAAAAAAQTSKAEDDGGWLLRETQTFFNSFSENTVPAKGAPTTISHVMQGSTKEGEGGRPAAECAVVRRANFHGGARPDLADIEMFGVMKAILEHPTLGGKLLSDGVIREWVSGMKNATLFK